MGLLGPAGNAGARRRGRRRGLVVGAAIGSAASRRRNNQDAEAEDVTSNGQSDDMQQMAALEKLGQLKASGVLTQEEFDAKKQEILNS